MLNLNDRDLMALEILKSMLESPFYFDANQRQVGIEPAFAAKEAVAFADSLRRELALQSPGTITLSNDSGDSVSIKPEVVEEVKRLSTEGRQADAIKILRNEGVSQKAAKDYVDTLDKP